MALIRTMPRVSKTPIYPAPQEAEDQLWGNSIGNRARFSPYRYIAIFTLCMALSWVLATLARH